MKYPNIWVTIVYVEEEPFMENSVRTPHASLLLNYSAVDSVHIIKTNANEDTVACLEEIIVVHHLYLQLKLFQCCELAGSQIDTFQIYCYYPSMVADGWK